MEKPQFQFLSQANFKQIRSDLDMEWEKFFIKGLEPERTRPVILHSWRRCRDLYQVDPHMETLPVLLGGEDLLTRREQNEILPLAQPVLDELTDVLNNIGYLTGFFDAAGWLLEMRGEPRLLEAIQGHYNVKEEFVGTTSAGLALIERRPIQVLASEYYRVICHSFCGCAAPIMDPVSHEPVGIILASGYKEAIHPHVLVAVWTAAHKIEQELRQRQMVREQQLVNEYLKMATRWVSDGVLCVDRQGKVLQINPAASRLCGVAENISTLEACPDLKQAVLPVLQQADDSVEPGEQQIYCPRTNRSLNLATFPIIREGRIIGAVALIPSPERGAGERGAEESEEKVGRPRQVQRARAKYRFEHIVGEVVEIKQAMELARLAASNTLPVLITGESGTGKEMFAQAIHNASARASQPFIVVNCGAIPHELIEAEMFGYEAGAFTGAKREGSAGKFETADGGTILLDEVSELSPSAQVALLRVLQEREIVRLGSSLPTAIDVRVMAASNKDLRQEVNGQRFRRDLYYRLNVLSLELPPLRQRREDMLLLIDHLLLKVAEELGQDQLRMEQEVVEHLMAYDWPGNVRELRNVIQRATAAKGSTIRLKDLPPEVKATRVSIGELQAGWSPLGQQEREYLLKILEECAGNVTAAARQLGLSRVTLHRKMKKLSITRPEPSATNSSTRRV